MQDKVIAFDAYNFMVIGNISKALRASRADTDHITVVFQRKINELPENNGATDGKQPSRQLLRSGCIQ